jgi:hypothetical protein
MDKAFKFEIKEGRQKEIQGKSTIEKNNRYGDCSKSNNKKSY